MSSLVALIGFLILGVGIAVVLSPPTLRKVIHQAIEYRWLNWLSGLRLLVGGVLVIAASATRMPGFITGLGVLLIAAGITLPLLGEERVDRMASWWFHQSDMMVGVWGTVVAILGAVVIWASFREGKGVLRDACEIHGDSTVCRDATVPRPLDVVLRGLLS